MAKENKVERTLILKALGAMWELLRSQAKIVALVNGNSKFHYPVYISGRFLQQVVGSIMRSSEKIDEVLSNEKLDAIVDIGGGRSMALVTVGPAILVIVFTLRPDELGHLMPFIKEMAKNHLAILFK